MAIDGRLNFDTKIDTKGFTKGASTLGNQLGSLKSMVVKLGTAIGVAFGVSQIVAFGKASVTAATNTSNAFSGLQSILEGQGRSYSDATTWLQNYVSDGLVPLQNAVTAYKNLASRGYDDTQIRSTMEALKDSSAYGRQASLSMGEALQSATEGLKNENSILVDNAGVTKNVSQMWKEYANSIGVGVDSLTTEQKIQAEVNGIMKETRFQTGDAAKVAQSFSGQVSQLSYNFNDLKVALGNVLTTVLQPIIAYLNTAVKKITSLIKSTASLLGITTNIADSSSSLSDSTSSATSAYEDMTSSAEDTEKANENILASFDKMNKLGSIDNDTSSSSTSTPTDSALGGTIATTIDVDTKSANKKLTKFIKNVKKIFATIFDPIKKAWDKNGEKVVDSIKFAFEGIWTLVKNVGKSFATVWNNGTGEKIVSNLLVYWSNLLEIIGLISRRFASAWDDGGVGTAIIQGILDIWNDMLETSIKITDSILEWAKNIDFSPLLTSFEGLTSALEPFTKDICDGIEWFWNNILLPMASWTIEDAIPVFINTLSDVISGISSVLETAAPVLEDLWENFLSPLASWAADVTLDVISKLGKAFKDLCESLDEKDIKVMLDLSGALATIWAVAKGKKAFKNLGKTISDNLSTATTSIKTWTSGEAFSKSAAEGGVGFGTKFCAALGAFFVGWSIGSAIYDAWGDELNEDILFPMYDTAVSAWNGVVTFFTESVPQFFTEFWAGLNEDILFPLYDTAVGAWNGIATFFTETIPQFFTEFWAGLNEDILFPLYDTAVGAWTSIDEFFTETVPQFFSDLWDNIKETFSDVGSWFTGIFEDAITGIKESWDGIKTWFSDRWEDIKSVFSGVKKWFSDKFTGAWSGIKEAFSSVKSWFQIRWDDIKSVFGGVKKWFSDKFSGAWSGIESAFSEVSKFFGGVWDDMTAGLSGAVNIIIDGLNWVIDGINSISFDMPDWDWLPDGIQGATLGFDIPEIPKLATGTVVPANYGEFTAVLGDNKREAEVVSPLSTMRQAVKEAIAEMGGTGGGDITIVLTLDGKTVYKTVVDQNKINKRKTGSNPLMI